MNFSKEQQAAITANNRELLVSAAAGSGKTAVLIEKIYTMLREDSLTVDRMLVVTFTRAAAAEMRERLKRRMAGDPSPALRRQRERLELAQISTLHSFCHKIVTAYFQVVDIDPLSAIADTTTSSNLFQQALDAAMEDMYNRAAGGDAAAGSLTAKFEDKQIVSMLTELYPFLMTLADPFPWLLQQAEKSYTLQDLETGEMAGTLHSDCRVLLDGARALQDSLQALAANPSCPEKYIPAILADIVNTQALMKASSKPLLAILSEAKRFALDKMPGLRNLSDAEKEINLQYKDLRKSLKDLAGKISALLPLSPEETIARLNAMQPALLGLHGLCQSLHSEYLQRKKQRSLLDPNDLEHMALEILAQPDIRREVASRYDAVFVDEYQDISGVQEALLNSIKRNHINTQRCTDGSGLTKQVLLHGQAEQKFFYVGDVKQSIYRFRQADPTLFMEKEKTFSGDASAPHRRIDLNRNYRSRSAVLDAVNHVFAQIMRDDVTEITYDSRARLYAGQETEADPPVQLHIFTAPLKSAQRTLLQAAAIGQEINRRVGQPFFDRKENKMRTLRYRDIAILAPRMKGVDDVFTRVLGAMHIPVYAEGSGAGLQSDEIAQVLCHLRLLDNIQDDLSLLAALRSPAIGFTDMELAQVRIHSKEGSYLSALRHAAGESDALARHCAQALSTFEHERFLMRSMPLAEYLWSWLSRSGLYAFYGCQPYGTLRQANLRLLCQKAVEFQSRGSGGLHAFLQSVVSAGAAKESVSPTVLGPKENVVRIMSIHKSKGLEFPVVFLTGLEAGFSGRNSSTLSMHQKLGVALPFIDEVRRVKGDTLLSAAVQLRSRSETLAERARVLYVGMTRARDELIMMGCMEVPPFTASPPSAYEVANASHMLEWLSLCTDPRKDILSVSADISPQFSTAFPQKCGGMCIVSHNSEEETEDLLHCAQPVKDLDSLAQRQLRLARLTEETQQMAQALPPVPDDTADPLLPDLPRGLHPFKVGVTALVRARHSAELPSLVQSGQEDPGEMETIEVKRLPLPLTRPRQIADLPAVPAFMQDMDSQSRGIQRGVAAHKALCLLQYAPLRSQKNTQELRHAIIGQLQSLLKKQLLTDEEFHLLDIGALAAFFESPWGQDALHAGTVKREWGFVLTLPEEDGMMVQGVIDLCYLKDGAWVLVDYKTDHVKDAQELWPLYGAQAALYARALRDITGHPVRSMTLYSLSLGEGTTQQPAG